MSSDEPPEPRELAFILADLDVVCAEHRSRRAELDAAEQNHDEARRKHCLRLQELRDKQRELRREAANRLHAMSNGGWFEPVGRYEP